MAALLGLCLAGAGCLSNSLHNDAFAVRCGPATGAALAEGVSLQTPVASATPHRPLFARWRRQTVEEPALAMAPAGQFGSAPAAVMLRPVPAGTEPPAVVASAWQPVQRLTPPGAEAGPSLGSAERVSRVLPVSTSGAQELTVVPLTIASSDRGSGEERGENTTLPTPRVVPQPGPGQASVLPPMLPHGQIPHGQMAHGPGYPAPVPPPDVPREFRKRALSAYIIEPPDILVVQATAAITKGTQPIAGPHLVRPDGTIGLGVYGNAFVAGKTIEEARDAVARLLQVQVFKDEKKTPYTVEEIKRELQLDVAAYNSKFFYVITDGGGYGAQIFRLPITGNETVLDALAQVQGLPPVASKKRIWIALATPGHDHPMVLPVDWKGVALNGLAATNYQVFPGDRIYVDSNKLIKADSFLAKLLSPVERIFGVTLLGATTVNTIKNGSTSGGTPAIR
jgi:polysaccharide export outer membrane protein